MLGLTFGNKINNEIRVCICLAVEYRRKGNLSTDITVKKSLSKVFAILFIDIISGKIDSGIGNGSLLCRIAVNSKCIAYVCDLVSLGLACFNGSEYVGILGAKANHIILEAGNEATRAKNESVGVSVSKVGHTVNNNFLAVLVKNVTAVVDINSITYAKGKLGADRDFTPLCAILVRVTERHNGNVNVNILGLCNVKINSKVLIIAAHLNVLVKISLKIVEPSLVSDCIDKKYNRRNEKCKNKNSCGNHNRKLALGDINFLPCIFFFSFGSFDILVFTHDGKNLSLYIILGKGVSKACGEGVTALVIIVSGMTLHPDELNLMDLGKRIKLLPEIGILQLILSTSPAGGTPGLDPAEKKGVHYVFGVRIKCNLAGLTQCGETLDSRGQLHTVVGGLPLTAGKLFFILSIDENSAPSTLAGITSAGSVGINAYFFHIILYLQENGRILLRPFSFMSLFCRTAE